MWAINHEVLNALAQSKAWEDSGQAAINAASLMLFLPRTITNEIPAAKKPKAAAITSDRVSNNTAAVATLAAVPIRMESFMHATIG